MFKRLVSLVLALALCVSAAAPAAWAQETIPGLEAMPNSNNSEMQPLLDVMNSPEMQAFFDSNPEFKTAFDQMIGDIKPEAETLDPSIQRYPQEYTLELKPGETKEIEVKYSGPGPADLTQERVVVDAKSSNPKVATATIKTWNDNSNRYKLLDYVTITVQASKDTNVPAEATITATTVSEGRSATISDSLETGEITYLTDFEPFRADDWIINVKVDKKISPPKVELRLVPDSTTMLVTGTHPALDCLNAGKAVSKVLEVFPELYRNIVKYILPTVQELEQRTHAGSKKYTAQRTWKLYTEKTSLSTIYKYTSLTPDNAPAPIKKLLSLNLKAPRIVLKLAPAMANLARSEIKSLLSPLGIATYLIEKELQKIKVPRVDPEVYLEVVVTNPDNNVPLYYDIQIDTPRVTHSAKDMIVISPANYAQFDHDPYNWQIIYPDSLYMNVHQFRLDPELVYNESNNQKQMSTTQSYTSDITVSGSWGEWKGEDEKIPGGKYKESIQLEVISLLGPKSEYQQMEHFFSDMTETVVNRWKSITELPQLSDSAFVELLDSMPVGTPLMTPIDKIPPKTPVISAPDKLMSPLQ